MDEFLHCKCLERDFFIYILDAAVFQSDALVNKYVNLKKYRYIFMYFLYFIYSIKFGSNVMLN